MTVVGKGRSRGPLPALDQQPRVRGFRVRGSLPGVTAWARQVMVSECSLAVRHRATCSAQALSADIHKSRTTSIHDPASGSGSLGTERVGKLPKATGRVRSGPGGGIRLSDFQAWQWGHEWHP